MSHPLATTARDVTRDVRLPAQPFFTTAEQRVALARDRFFGLGERPTGLVSEAVLQSWTRCVGARHDPMRSIGFDPVSRPRMRAAQERNRELLLAAEAPLARLEGALASSGCRVLLTDAAGLIVRAPSVPPDRAGEPVLRCAARVGVSLDEHQVGTNAPGLVVKTMAPTVVTGGEHFFLNTGTLSCAAAPIRNGCGRLAGVLDLTIEGRGFGFDAAALVGLYATLIENELLLARSRAAAVLRFQVCPTLLDGSMQALAGIDDRGRLAWSNGVAQRLLGLAAGHGVDAQPLLGLTLGELLRRAGQPPRPLPLPNGLTVWAQVAAAPRSAAPAEPVPVSSEATAMPDAVRGAVAGPATGAPPDAERCGATAHPDAVPTLDQHTRQTIRRVVDECGGNLSAAARRLGVSRGLLYRRLRG